MNGISEIPLSSFSLNLQASSYAELGDDTLEKFNILEDRIRENTMLTEVIHWEFFCWFCSLKDLTSPVY